MRPIGMRTPCCNQPISMTAAIAAAGGSAKRRCRRCGAKYLVVVVEAQMPGYLKLEWQPRRRRSGPNEIGC